MANKYLSSFLLFIVSCSVFIGSSSEAAKLYVDDANIEGFAFSKMLGLLDHMTGAMRQSVSGTLHILRLLAGDPEALGPEEVRTIEDGFENIKNATKDIKMAHSLLLGILLYPLAFILCCPISCCLACLVGCIVMCLIWVVVVVLVIVGTLLFTPGFAQNGLPYHAASTAEVVAQTLSDICRESVKALEKLAEDGHHWPVKVALNGMEFLIEQMEQVGGQVQALLNRAESAESDVREKLESVDTIFSSLLNDIRQTLHVLKKNQTEDDSADFLTNVLWGRKGYNSREYGHYPHDYPHYGRNYGHHRHRYHYGPRHDE